MSLIKKKVKPTVWSQMYQNVDIKHVVNINDVSQFVKLKLVFIN